MGPDPRGGGGGAQGEARVWLAAGRCENSIIGSGVGREEASELSGTAGVGGRTGASPEGAPQGRGELAECVSGPAGHGEGLTACGGACGGWRGRGTAREASGEKGGHAETGRRGSKGLRAAGRKHCPGSVG